MFIFVIEVTKAEWAAYNTVRDVVSIAVGLRQLHSNMEKS